MKKIIIILSLLLVLSGCSSSNSDNQVSNKDESTDLNVVDKSLPTDEKIMSYISKVYITTENWKEIFCVDVDYHEEINNFGETIINHKDVEAKINVKDGYLADLSTIGLKLYDNKYDSEIIISDLTKLDKDTMFQLDVFYSEFWSKDIHHDGIKYNDGDIVYQIQKTSTSRWELFPFDFDNFSCTQAGGYVYKVDVPEELIVHNEDDELFDYVEVRGVDNNSNYNFYINDYEFCDNCFEWD